MYNWRLCKRRGGHSPLDSIKPYQRSRFAAPHAQRSELEASVNNALLDGTVIPDRSQLILATAVHGVGIDSAIQSLIHVDGVAVVQ
jgi:hypothetical protein